MRHLLLILLSTCTIGLFGQDTITVETFVYSSQSRDSVFSFPDNPGETYRKIIMEYGMRCHDLAVGSGDVGCREWDYSCNTIIYDSSRVDSVLVDDGNGGFIYEQSSPVRYEIMSFVTPYGNGLDLGPDGVYWTFDVTDFAPILRGKKRIGLIGGGQNQEEMFITFKFIKGTPSREVIDIKPIWPLQLGVSGDPIINNLRFEPRTLKVENTVDRVKLRSVITGHGQTGEFTPFQHRLEVNDGAEQFQYTVWKECSNVPVYPQGGTWILDRAGWCPGDPSLLWEFDVDPTQYEDGDFKIDYAVKDIVQAPDLRYIVNNQVVFYGPLNFQNDLELLEIIRPTNRVEHARINPACFNPVIVIRNNGSSDLQNAEIKYGLSGQTEQMYTWSGNLSTGQVDTIELDYITSAFWGDKNNAKFYAEITTSDDQQDNNRLSSDFKKVDHYQGERVIFFLTTNRAPRDNVLTLTNESGDEILRYDNLSSTRGYFDEVTLGPGCYRMLLTDSRDDGLYYWAYEQNGPNIGRGGLQLIVDDVEQLEFEPEFGRFVQYEFSLSMPTSSTEEYSRLKVYPNPSQDVIIIENEGVSSPSNLEIYDLTGKLIKSHNHNGRTSTKVDINDVEPGSYILILKRNGHKYRTTMIKL